MTPILKRVLWSALRGLLFIIAERLVSHGYLDRADADGLVAEVLPFAVGGLMVIGSLAWAGIQEWRARRLLHTALAMPAGATVQETKQAIKEGMAVSATLPQDSAPYLTLVDPRASTVDAKPEAESSENTKPPAPQPDAGISRQIRDGGPR